jgi:hypothetical protein
MSKSCNRRPERFLHGTTENTGSTWMITAGFILKMAKDLFYSVTKPAGNIYTIMT